MTTRPPPPGRRHRARPAERPRGAVELLWATVLRRFRDHVHETGPRDRNDPVHGNDPLQENDSLHENDRSAPDREDPR